MQRKLTMIDDHVISRFRERWRDSAYLTDSEIKKRVLQQVHEGLRTKAFVKTPGGDYFPFSVNGTDGYIVVNNENEIITVLPEEYCKEVTAFRKNGADHVEE